MHLVVAMAGRSPMPVQTLPVSRPGYPLRVLERPGMVFDLARPTHVRDHLDERERIAVEKTVAARIREERRIAALGRAPRLTRRNKPRPRRSSSEGRVWRELATAPLRARHLAPARN